MCISKRHRMAGPCGRPMWQAHVAGPRDRRMLQGMLSAALGFSCTLTEHELKDSSVLSEAQARRELALASHTHTCKSVFAERLRTYVAVFDSAILIVVHSMPTIHAEHWLAVCTYLHLQSCKLHFYLHQTNVYAATELKPTELLYMALYTVIGKSVARHVTSRSRKQQNCKSSIRCKHFTLPMFNHHATTVHTHY